MQTSPLRITTWNVNSVKARLETVTSWLSDNAPDVVCLQELKCETEALPREAFERLGYNVEVLGQKTYNGVALLSKYPVSDVRLGLPGLEDDPQARYIEAVIEAPRPVRVGGLYAPNGNPVESEKYPYKLRWMQALTAHAKTLLGYEEALILCGDYNIIPEPEDCYDPAAWAADALFLPESRAAWRRLLNLGFISAFEAANSDGHRYTFWDYQAGAWQKDHGIRIDHHLLSAQAADRLQGHVVDKAARGRDKPSDHAPATILLSP